jgi:hypothetical protein
MASLTETPVKYKINKLTDKVGLDTNTNYFKKEIQKYIKTHDITVTSKKKNEDSDTMLSVEVSPKIKGSHVALAACTQLILQKFLKNCFKSLSTDKSGMKRLTRDYIKTALRMEENRDFRYFFTPLILTNFNKEFTYDIPDPKGFSRLCDLGEKYTISPKGVNFLKFLMKTLLSRTLDISLNFMIYAKKKTLDYRAIQFTLLTLFSGTNTLKNELNEEFNRVSSALGKDDWKNTLSKEDDEEDNDEDEDKSSDEDDDKSSDEEEEDEDKSSDEEEEDEKITQVAKKENKKVLISESDSSSESESESEEEEEEEVKKVKLKPTKKPVKKQTAKKKAGKKKQTVKSK